MQIIDLTKIDNIVFDGVDHSDYPDFCDAYVESADYEGVPLTEDEIYCLNELHPDFVYESLLNQIL